MSGVAASGARVGVEAQESAATGRIRGDSGVAAESAHRRLDHERGERGADQGVKRVSAFLHEAYAGVGHRGMPTGTHAPRSASIGVRV